ncbi:MAG: efflux RND transporter periplasmic adaptor subunit [Polyangiales bacterium]
MPQALKRKSRAWIVWLLVLVAAVAGAVIWKRTHQPPGLAVRLWRVRRGSVRDLVSSVSTGRVAAVREANLRAEIAGRVVRLHHRRGERVRAGEPLVSYDLADLRDRLRTAEAAVTVASAQRAQSAANARLAERNARRAERLSREGAAPAAESETLEGQSAVAQSAVAAAEAARAQALANVAAARGTITRAVVRAPFDGVVLTTSVEEGEVTAPGAPMLTLAEDSSLHLDVDLDEADLGRVHVGDPAELSFDAFPNERLRGRVTEIAPSVTADLRGNRSIAIRVALPEDPRLRVGMSADADVVVATRADVVYVPPTAVVGRGTDRSVYVVADNVARRRVVHVGVSTWEAVEVTDGVRVGEDIVLRTNVDGLTDGSRVRVVAHDRGAAR